MAVSLSTRLRALWLACLLVLAPAGPLGLIVTGHATDRDAHAATLVHDAADHGISAGALADRAPDRHCIFCQTASSVRFGWAKAITGLHRPGSSTLCRVERPAALPDLRLGVVLPARAPPPRA